MDRKTHLAMRLVVCIVLIAGALCGVSLWQTRNLPQPIQISEVPYRGLWKFKTCYLDDSRTRFIFAEPSIITPDGNRISELAFFAGVSSCYLDIVTLPEKTMRWETDRHGNDRLYYNPGIPNRYGHPSSWVRPTA